MLLITTMAQLCARVVYSLGKAVTESPELGSHQLVEGLGQGETGGVAKHRLFARPAAIKLIRSNRAPQERTSDAVTRFEREAQPRTPARGGTLLSVAKTSLRAAVATA